MVWPWQLCIGAGVGYTATYDIQGPLVAIPITSQHVHHLAVFRSISPRRLHLLQITTQAHFPVFTSIADFAVFRPQPHHSPRLA